MQVSKALPLPHQHSLSTHAHTWPTSMYGICSWALLPSLSASPKAPILWNSTQIPPFLSGFFKPFQSQMILPPFGGKCSVNMYWMNEWILAWPHSLFFFKILFIYLFLERGKWREKERERNVNVWLPLAHPSLCTWPATQTWALTGNRICSPLVRSRHSAHWAAPARTWPQSSDHLVMAIVFNLLKI